MSKLQVISIYVECNLWWSTRAYSVLVIEYTCHRVLLKYILLETLCQYSYSKVCSTRVAYFNVNDFNMLVWIHVVSVGLVGSLCMTDIFLNYGKISALIAKMAFSNGVLEKVLVLKYSYSSTRTQVLVLKYSLKYSYSSTRTQVLVLKYSYSYSSTRTRLRYSYSTQVLVFEYSYSSTHIRVLVFEYSYSSTRTQVYGLWQEAWQDTAREQRVQLPNPKT